jgi:hypothetical protein
MAMLVAIREVESKLDVKETILFIIKLLKKRRKRRMMTESN